MRGAAIGTWKIGKWPLHEQPLAHPTPVPPSAPARGSHCVLSEQVYPPDVNFFRFVAGRQHGDSEGAFKNLPNRRSLRANRDQVTGIVRKNLMVGGGGSE